MSEKFRSYRVTGKVAESRIITSFLIQPESGDIPDFCPGEYLIFDLPCGPNGAMILRNYSISGRMGNALRVTIKREPAAPGFGPGAGSAYFHDKVKVGSLLGVAGPFGQFQLDRGSHLPVVLISGGVGLTPMVAMAHDLAKSGRRFVFLHACEDGAVHAMGAEMRALAKTCPQMTAHFCYRLPRHEDTPAHDFDSTGFLTTGRLQSLLALDDYEFYLCGPGPFMQAMYEIITDLGVRDDRIRCEFFGPAALLRPREKAGDLPPGAQRSHVESAVPIVHFAKSGRSVPWDGRFENLLEFAEEQELFPDFSCRAGTCKSCKTKVITGEIDYLFEPFERPDNGYILICCAVPKSDVTLDL